MNSFCNNNRVTLAQRHRGLVYNEDDTGWVPGTCDGMNWSRQWSVHSWLRVTALGSPGQVDGRAPLTT